MHEPLEQHVRMERTPHQASWVLSYADIMTNILTFFVLLLAMSRISSSRYEELAAAFGNRPERSLGEIQQDLEAVVSELGLEERVRVQRTEDGLLIELENSILFASGEAELQEDSARLLRPISERLASSLEEGYGVVVEGYTDDVPIHNARFRSNWELSTSRAIHVMEELVGAGFPQRRISVQGFADTRAHAATLAGASPDDLAQARAGDRRVALRVVEMRPSTGEER